MPDGASRLVPQDKQIMSWQTSVRYIVVELAGGGSVAVAVRHVGVAVAVALGFVGFGDTICRRLDMKWYLVCRIFPLIVSMLCCY